MDWKKGRRSGNIEDRRGQRVSGPRRGTGAYLPLLMTVTRRFGWKGMLVGLVVLFVLGGGLQMFSSPPEASQPAAGPGAAGAATAPSDAAADFVSVILASTEDAWRQIFAEHGATYREPTLVLFEDRVQSACGFQTAATGPFYGPRDQKVYLDLGFFRELARLGGSGEFAAAYVIGHEVGHHVQTLSGTSEREARAQAGRSRAQANALSVAQELQADCYAGVWAQRTDRAGVVTLSPGDVERGMEAARAIGDDRLQRQAGRAVNPESFTHGSSEQRARWFLRGIQEGTVEACDTFQGLL